MSAQDQVAKPADEEDADDGGKACAQQVDAVIVRLEQPGEDRDAQQPQHGREDVRRQIDARLSDQHNAASPVGSLALVCAGRTASISATAVRIACTGVPEKDATENATSSLPARRSS